MRSLVVIAIAIVAACQPTAASASPPPAPATVGFRTFDVADPISHAKIPAAVFYPAIGPANVHTDIGPYPIAAGAKLPIVDGRHPLIALSHGHGGSMWGHHDLAVALARHGYVVAVVEHAGDNYHDQSGFRSDRVLFGRAYQISATIDAVLADPDLASHVDPTRIGVTGFSAGGWTSLLLVGAKPDFALVSAYCGRHANDTEVCGGPLRRELESPKPTIDRRIKAAFAMAPFAIPFGAGAFKDVTAAIFLSWGEADEILLPGDNAALVLEAPTLRGKRSYPKAGHYVFLPPCSHPELAHPREICLDPAGVDRAAIHEQIAKDAVAFFDATLR